MVNMSMRVTTAVTRRRWAVIHLPTKKGKAKPSEDDPTKGMSEAELMEYYHQRKCANCGQVKCIVDFPLELEPVAPGISKYCVICATNILEADCDG